MSSQERDRRAWIVTVGLESRANAGLIESLGQGLVRVGGDFLLLLPSPESREEAEKLIESLRWPPGAFRIETVESAHDLDGVFRTVNACINRLIARGFSADQITVDYTGGTKVMSSGAVLSAIYNSCERLEYITGGHNGRPHQALFTRPLAVVAYRELHRAREHILATQLRSAAVALKSIDESLLADYDRNLTEMLRTLARAYSAWDANRIGDFLRLHDTVDFEAGELHDLRLREEQRSPLAALAEDFAKKRYSPAMSVEMRNSAFRLMREGHFDDAVMRTYRALEILAQWALRERYQIVTDDLDTRKVPPRDRARFEAMRSLDDGRVRIGLRKAFELLDLLDDPAGQDFVADQRLAECLKMRDHALLAHGTAPMSLNDCDKILGVASEYFRRRIENFDVLCEALQFPWLDGAGRRKCD